MKCLTRERKRLLARFIGSREKNEDSRTKYLTVNSRVKSKLTGFALPEQSLLQSLTGASLPFDWHSPHSSI